MSSYSPVSSTGLTVGLPTPSAEYFNSTGHQSSAPLLGAPFPTHDQTIPLHSMQSLSPALSNDCVSHSPKSEKNDSIPERAASAPEGRNKPRRKTHNAIEKRYRTRLNDKIAELRDRIPSLRQHPMEAAEDQYTTPQATGNCNPQKINKANILEKATEYILHLEACNRSLQIQLNQALLASRHGARGHDSAVQQQTRLNSDGNSSVSMLSRPQPPTTFTYTIDDLLPDDTATFGP